MKIVGGLLSNLSHREVVLHHDLRRIPQIIRIEICPAIAVVEVARQHDGADSFVGGFGGVVVNRAIADHPALRQINAEVLGRLQQHPRSRLSPIGVLIELGVLVLGVPGAVVDAVKVALGLTSNLQRDFGATALNLLNRGKSAGDRRLIGHHNGEVAQRVDQSNRLCGPWDQRDLVWVIGVADLNVYGAVTVDEDSGSGPRLGVGWCGDNGHAGLIARVLGLARDRRGSLKNPGTRMPRFKRMREWMNIES